MVPGVEWCERDGKRYLRVDYTVGTGLEQLLEMNREMNEQVAALEPRQRVLTVVDESQQDGMAELFKQGLTAYRKIHHPRCTVFAVAGLPRTATVMLRAFNTIGARGRLAGFRTEAEAVDWLLGH